SSTLHSTLYTLHPRDGAVQHSVSSRILKWPLYNSGTAFIEHAGVHLSLYFSKHKYLLF
ncbi:hypothetical protein J6590_104407, partial [Homalodisca vitripennis]